MIDDSAIIDELSKVSLHESDEVYLTLVALHVLKNEFDEREEEWTLIGKKAKDYLEQSGLQNPDILLKKFTLKFVQ